MSILNLDAPRTWTSTECEMTTIEDGHDSLGIEAYHTAVCDRGLG